MSDRRLSQLRELLNERELDAVVISNEHSRFFLTGYTGHDHPPDESAGVAVIGCSTARMFVSKNNVEWAASESPLFDIVGWTLPWSGHVIEHLASIGAAKVGFEEEALSVADFRRLSDRDASQIDWLPLEGSVGRLRLRKDAAEIETLSRASLITDAALLDALGKLDEGMTEKTLARLLDDAMRRLGAEGPGFSTIVASGPNAARPHHSAGERPIAAGEPVVIDMGAEVDGYRADLTRTVCLGDPTPELSKVYTIVLDAQRAVLASVKAGLTGKETDDLARNVIGAAGYGDQFIHGLGHGVGLQIHEGPSAGQRSSDTLESGMTLTIEPGIYIPGWGGVRIEDLVVIEEHGCRNLTTAPKRPAVHDMISGAHE